jgi:hypothetical protein
MILKYGILLKGNAPVILKYGILLELVDFNNILDPTIWYLNPFVRNRLCYQRKDNMRNGII